MMNPKGRISIHNPRRRGTMAIVVIAIALTTAALITAAFSQTTSASSVQLRALAREQATFLADAGLDHALIMLINDTTWRTGFTNKPLGAGSYTVTLTDDAGDVIITSVGTVGTQTAQIDIRVGWE